MVFVFRNYSGLDEDEVMAIASPLSCKITRVCEKEVVPQIQQPTCPPYRFRWPEDCFILNPLHQY